MLNLRHIEVFHTVYVNRSISGAARALNVSQPTISNLIRHAESRLGFPLFHRGKGGLVPTVEADTLFDQVADIYDRVVSLGQTSKNIARPVEGHISLSVLPGLGISAAPLAIARFRSDHPSVSFDLHTIHHADLPRMLVERRCDLAISYDAPPRGKFEHRVIGRGELVLLYRRDDMPDAPTRLELQLVEGSPFISLSRSGPLGALFNREVYRQGLELDEVVTISTMYMAAALIRLGVGVAVVDEFTAQACCGDDLDYRPFETPLTFDVECIYLADRPLSRIAETFMDVLAATTKAATAEPPPWEGAPAPRSARRSLGITSAGA